MKGIYNRISPSKSLAVHLQVCLSAKGSIKSAIFHSEEEPDCIQSSEPERMDLVPGH